MHRPIKERLEDYLGGKVNLETERRIEQHLASCAACRETIEKMRRHSAMLGTLRTPEVIDPAPGFYARVLERIESRRIPSLWDLLLEPVFGRRLVYALLTLFLVLGTLLVSSGGRATEGASASGYYSPESFLAEQPVAPHIGIDPDYDRGVVLVNLATYKE